MAKELTGIVMNDSADKTINVMVTSRETHPIYGKQYTVTRKYLAHDANNQAHKGDRVIICESRPVSKRKNFTLLSIAEKARDAIVLKDDIVEVEAK